MKIIELILDEEQDDIGVDAISIVESPAIESDFVALKNQEIKLAEVDKEKKILMGALLIPNKPIYRNGGEGEYYIYFSKDTIVKASQMFLQNGKQSNSTLEHNQALNGLTLVESWIVESKEQDKSAMYGLDVPVGTWMGSVKVNNDDVWNEYVKTNKVKGFSIEGYFADKMEAPKDKIKEDMSKEKIAQELLSKIEKIVKGEKQLGKVELALDGQLKEQGQKAQSIFNDGRTNAESVVLNAAGEMEKTKKQIEKLAQDIDKAYSRGLKVAKEIGVNLDNTTVGKNYKKAFSDVQEYIISCSTEISKLRKFKI